MDSPSVTNTSEDPPQKDMVLEARKILKATSLGALKGVDGGKRFKGFRDMQRFRQGVARALKYLTGPRASFSSNKIMTACSHSGEQHRAVLDYLLEFGYLRERDNYRPGQARYEVGSRLRKVLAFKSLAARG